MVQRWRISSNSQHLLPTWASWAGCLWWFKDEEFQAIHNAVGGLFGTIGVFMMVQRWRISSNSQHGWSWYLHRWWCLWWFKDEEFQAIHNNYEFRKLTFRGVYDGSKMKNFKQFTTVPASFFCEIMVFMMVQRWRISSNSQLRMDWHADARWCLWWFKDEEFQAIHNSIAVLFRPIKGVYDGSKMKNFKQFTTLQFLDVCLLLVFMMVQRWRISSNSQQ